MADELAIVHLVWAPLGVGVTRRFLDAYRRHDAGAAHRLHVLLNGFSDDPSLAGHATLLRDVDHTALRLERPLHDLAAYRVAIDRIDAEWLCFVNSYAEPLVDGWAGLLLDQVKADGVGIAGAGGSYESARSAAPRPLKPIRALHFPPFPNPHLRSNAFVLRRSLALDLDWPLVATKLAALRLESGSASLTRQVQTRGLAPVVVGRSGRVYRPPEWPASETFRSADQRELLVADNRTHQYAEAEPAERARLAAMAWGTP